MKFLIFDTNIVIDYLKADQELFSLVSQYVGEVCIADKLIDELRNQYGCPDVSSLGINLVHAEKEEVIEAQTLEGEKKLSLYDWICFLVAKRLGYCCVTNDNGLRNQCLETGVETIRGGRLVVELCRRGGITKERAHRFVSEIVRLNPWSKGPWVERFREEIDSLPD